MLNNSELILFLPCWFQFVYVIFFIAGRWTEEEENFLSQCVREQTNTKEGDSVTSGVIWSKIAEKLGTRTEKQCRSKWYDGRLCFSKVFTAYF